MPRIIETEVFADWLAHLRDRRGTLQIVRRIRRLELGNPGDVAPVGDGVSEMRIRFGPGYRVYFGGHGADLVVLVGGGDKSTQRADIERAKRAWQAWKEARDG